MNRVHINEVQHHKHLGIFLSNDGTWHEHINYITSKAWQKIYVMRKLKFLLDRESLNRIYISFIRPTLEYADIVWNNCTQYEINQIEKVQQEAARIVTGATRLEEFSKKSGLKVNFSKTHVVWIGSKKYSTDSIKTRWKLQWGINRFKLLGITFDTDLTKMLTLNFSERQH